MPVPVPMPVSVVEEPAVALVEEMLAQKLLAMEVMAVVEDQCREGC